MTITKQNLIQAVKQNLELPKTDYQELVEAVFDILIETLERGNDIKLSGFGSFTLHNKQARRGRNPKTGEEIEISSRRVVTFKASKLMVNTKE